MIQIMTLLGPVIVFVIILVVLKFYPATPYPPRRKNVYHEYLKSPAWRGLRQMKLQEAGYRCQKCGSGYRLQCHHENYDRLGHERLSDLKILCNDCHEKAHGIIK